MDVKTTFLNGDLKEKVYIQKSKSFMLPKNKKKKIYKLVKSLYNLKQALKTMT